MGAGAAEERVDSICLYCPATAICGVRRLWKSRPSWYLFFRMVGHLLKCSCSLLTDCSWEAVGRLGNVRVMYPGRRVRTEDESGAGLQGR